jgi:hypothetical protein
LNDTGIELVDSPDQVTAEWLTTVLRAAGELDSGVVSSVDGVEVGTGQVGDCIRFSLTYEGGCGPETVVGKFPAADATSREAAAATRTYEVETRFYQQLRDRVAITTPRPYVALLDLESNRFVLLMNDLAPAVQGDQLAGCDVGAAALAMSEAAKLHAPVWDDATLSELDWLDRGGVDGRAMYTQLLSMLYPAFLERYGDRVDAAVVEAGTHLVERLPEYLSPRPGPLTAAHGDYRLDNMLFAPDGSSVTTVDWQTVSLAPGVTDVSYFLGTSLTPELRARHERDLVRTYHEHLRSGGVADLSVPAVWDDYRRFAFSGFLMAVLASMLVGQTDRGDDMFMAMANRSGRMAIDLDTLSMLDA